jgi:tight adherence protein B
VTALLPAVLAGAAVALLLGLPRPGAARLAELVTSPVGARAPVPRLLTVAAPLPVRVAVLLGAALAAAFLLGPVPAALLLAAGLGFARAHRRFRESRQVARERAAAIEACEALAGELRAGRPAEDALSAAAELALGPSRDTLRAAAVAARLGAAVPAVLAGGAAASAVPELLRALAACWSVCTASGTGLADAVERLQEGLRAAAEQRRLLDAELAGPRASAVLLALLPLGGLLLAAALGADPLHVLLHTPLGLVCLVVGVALDAAGVLWVTRLVDRAARG